MESSPNLSDILTKNARNWNWLGQVLFTYTVVLVLDVTRFGDPMMRSLTFTTCENCGASRFDAKGKPREYTFHFPLKARLASLLKCGHYVEAVRWEYLHHKSNPSYIPGLLYYNTMSDNTQLAPHHHHDHLHRRL